MYQGTIVLLPEVKASGSGFSRERSKPERIGVRLESADDGQLVAEDNLIEPGEISWKCLRVIGAEVKILKTISGYTVTSPYG